MISEDEELDLKRQGLLGHATHTSLVHALLLECALLFGLRGYKELKDVRYSNFQFTNIGPRKVKVVFFENCSKTNHPGISGGSNRGIRGPHLEDPEDPYSISCLIALYMARLPANADLDKAFWFSPKKSPTKNTSVWYKNIPMGENPIRTYIKDLMAAGGYQGNYSNHSLRVTTVNRLIDGGMSDSDIMARTGHRSARSLSTYRRVNEKNAGPASEVLTLKARTDAQTDAQTEAEEVQKILDSFTEDEWKDIDNFEDQDPFQPEAAFNLSISQLLSRPEEDATTSTSSLIQTDIVIPHNAVVTYTVIGE